MTNHLAVVVTTSNNEYQNPGPDSPQVRQYRKLNELEKVENLYVNHLGETLCQKYEADIENLVAANLANNVKKGSESQVSNVKKISYVSVGTLFILGSLATIYNLSSKTFLPY